MEERRRLKPQHKLFCKMYATDFEVMGNGVACYARVFKKDLSNPKEYATARTNSSKLLTNTDILDTINSHLENTVLNDAFVDSQLAFLIKQDDEKRTKLGAIAEYNKLKARIISKIDHTTLGEKLPTPIYGSNSTK